MKFVHIYALNGNRFELIIDIFVGDWNPHGKKKCFQNAPVESFLVTTCLAMSSQTDKFHTWKNKLSIVEVGLQYCF